MASKEVPNLPAADELDGTEELHVVQGGNSRRATLAEILALVPAAAGELHPNRRDVSFFIASAMSAGEEIVIWTPAAGEAGVFADDWAGSSGVCLDHPDAADLVLAVKRNGADVGTITVHVDGTIAFVTTGGTVTIDGAAGDYLTVAGPAIADATASRASFTLRGTAQ